MCLHMVVNSQHGFTSHLEPKSTGRPFFDPGSGPMRNSQTPILFRGFPSPCPYALTDAIVLLTSIFFISQEALHLVSLIRWVNHWPRKGAWVLVILSSWGLGSYNFLHLLWNASSVAFSCPQIKFKFSLVALKPSHDFGSSYPSRLFLFSLDLLSPVWNSTFQAPLDFFHFSNRKLYFSFLFLYCSCFFRGLYYIKRITQVNLKV